MPAPDALHHAFVEAAARWPDRTAVVDPGSGEVRYGELAELSDRLRDRLLELIQQHRGELRIDAAAASAPVSVKEASR